MLKLKLQYFGHLMWRTDSLEKTLMLGKIEGRRRRGWQRTRCAWMASPAPWTWVWTNSGSWWWTGTPGVLQSQRVGHDWATKLNWTELMKALETPKEQGVCAFWWLFTHLYLFPALFSKYLGVLEILPTYKCDITKINQLIYEFYQQLTWSFSNSFSVSFLCPTTHFGPKKHPF